MTEDECALAMDEPLIDQPYDMPQHAPHLVEWHNKHNHGERIRTYINLDLQRQVDDVITRWSQELRLGGAHDLAAVIIDVKTCEPVAYCGNADMDYERSGRWVDIARSPRSSGSILKPLLYCAALQDGQILPQMLLSDVPTDFGGFAPKNYNGTFQGAVPADDAIAQSLNVPCVGMLKDYGVMKFVEILKDCGITTFNAPASKYGLSVILGGAEVNLLEITKVYADMAACYQASDSTENYNFPLNDKVALYHTFEAMRKVNRPDQLDWRRVTSVQNVAWKTGTSYGSRDAWAIGLTPDHAVGVWVGNADGSGTPNLTGARTAGPVMFDLIGLLPFSQWFDKPDYESRQIRVCRHSGYRAGRYCTETHDIQAFESASEVPVCPYCHPVHLSLDGRYQVMDRSEPTNTKNMFTLPPTMEHYYKKIHPEYASLPPVKANKHQPNFQESPMRFLYPGEGSMIKIPRQLDGNSGRITCAVAHSNPNVELFWHCDNEFVGSTVDIHQISMSLPCGRHDITVVDNEGNVISRTIDII
jgi:penicillin-binding protein 1C